MLIQNRPWFQFLRQLSNFSQEFLFRLCLVLNQRITRYCHACTLPTPPPPKKQNKNKTKQFPSKLNSRPKQTGLLYDTNFFYSGSVTGVTAFMRPNAVFRQLKVSSGGGYFLKILVGLRSCFVKLLPYIKPKMWFSILALFQT